MGAMLSGALSGFDSSGGAQALGQGLNTAFQPTQQQKDTKAFNAGINQDVQNSIAQTQAGMPGQIQAMADQMPLPQISDPNAMPGAGIPTDASQPGGLHLQTGGEVPGRRPLHPMAHPHHPIWPFMHHISGVTETQQAPKANGSETINEQGQEPTVQGLQNGGLAQSHPPQPANFGGARPPPGTHAFQQGGPVPVRGANDMPMVHQKHQALPIGPNAGIVPASTEGQENTMGGQGGFPAMANGGPVPEGYDDGGFVGSGMMGVPGQGAPQMSGRWAGVSAGLPAGMAMGHNLRQQYLEKQARDESANNVDQQAKADRDAYRQAHGLPTEDQQTGAAGLGATVHNYVDHALNMFHLKSLDEKGNQNTADLPGHVPHPDVQNAGAPPAQAVPAAPAAGPPPQAIAAPGVTGGPPPTGAGAPVAGAPTLPGAQPGAAPGPAPAAPGAGGPAAPTPPAAAGAAAGVAAAKSTGDPAQVQASAISVQSGQHQAKELGAAETPAASGKPVSLTDKDWEEMEQAKFRAARAAAAAGMDPQKVYQSLTAMQTSHFQGQYIRNLGAAQQALATGDYSGMKDAMKAASYYLPNGQDLKFTEKGGVPMVTNPFYGMPGHEKDEQMVPITAASLNNMATAALDPKAFGSALIEQYKAGVQATSEITKAHAYETGMAGRYMQGSAQMQREQISAAMFPANYAQTMSKAELERAEAAEWRFRASGQGGGAKITAANALAYQKEGQKNWDDQTQGPLRPAPMAVPDPAGTKDPKTGQPLMVPNPHGGQPQRDPSQISPLFRGLSPQERQQGGALAQQIASANISNGMSGGTAAEIAARVQIASRTPGANHKGDDNKLYPNLVIGHGEDGQPPHVSVWDGHRYIQAWTSPNVLPDGEAPGRSGIEVSGGGNGAGGAAEPSVEEPPPSSIT